MYFPEQAKSKMMVSEKDESNQFWPPSCKMEIDAKRQCVKLINRNFIATEE